MSSTATEAKPNGDSVEIAHTPSIRTPMPEGVAVAALMAAMIGMLTLAVVNVFTAASKGFNAWVYSVGKLWMPGAQGIGPYSGKEMRLSSWLIVFLVGVGIATTLIWPPVFEHLAEFIAGR